MRIPIRFGIVVSFALVTVLCLSLLAYWITNRIRPNYLKLVEENLVDTSRVLAAYLAEDLESGRATFGGLHEVFQRVYEAPFTSLIYDASKESVDLKVYVTDAQGIVRYHSARPDLVSMDFSGWRNISRSLRGEYGARATRTDPNDPKTLQLHVTAPVIVDKELAGLLTVQKPITWATIFMEDARNEIIVAAIITGSIALVLSLLMSAWLLRPIGRLTEYARKAAEGKRTYLPRLGKVKELQDMADALQTMHKELEGKQYVEQYIQSLTHEIKSPVSAIQGAAELINETMPAGQRDRFMENIKVEANRINKIVDHLLELSAVEKLQRLEETASLDLTKTVAQVAQAFEAAFETHHLRVETNLEDHAEIVGDSFLLTRAIGNVIQNAIDFSPELGLVTINLTRNKGYYELEILDEGPGIPNFALGKIFDRFFSMPRPKSSKKSSGLGLAFVKEIVDLHGGSVKVENRAEGGARALLLFKVRTNFTERSSFAQTFLK